MSMLHRPTALLLQLEFPTWATARPWTYSWNFAVREGLESAGVDCVTVPVLADVPCNAPNSWVTHARRWLHNRTFDQVWVWLVHSPLDPVTLEWIAGLAPVRVGILMETLRYDEEDYAWAPHLRQRQGHVEEQIRYMTHVLAPDELDAEDLNARQVKPTLWWPQMVPGRCIGAPAQNPRYCQGVFHGTPYGPRQQWIHHPSLASHLTFAQPASPPTATQQLFDRLQRAGRELLGSGEAITESAVHRYVDKLKEIRAAEFAEWMTGLSDWAAIINLPSLAKFYGGRVLEGMAAGRPVISWRIPRRPRNTSLFEEGTEILTFNKEEPAALADALARVVTDASEARRIAEAARRKIQRYHTADVRMQQTLTWLETGQLPDYGCVAAAETAPSWLQEPRPPAGGGRQQQNGPIRTTVFLLSVDDPAFPACKAAIDAQEGAPFTLEIIQNVTPFSAAAQKMITDCATEFFIQVDEDMVLQPDAVATMEAVMRRAPDDVGMICFHLYDDDRGMTIQGVKIYRTALMKSLAFQDVKASEMDLLEQMGRHGIKWVLHPEVKGRHGTVYTPETIYRRYKTMYEKDIRQWNTLTADIRRKADQYRESGDPLALFALLGAVHGIVLAPLAPDREKDARQYALKELEVFRRLFLSTPPLTQPFDLKNRGTELSHPPLPFEQVTWKPDVAVLDSPSAPRHSAAARTVLIVTPYFWPSVGGVETVVEELGADLAASGLAVQVACYRQPDRTAAAYRGIQIIEVDEPDRMSGGMPTAALQVKELVETGQYDAVILIGSPANAVFYAILTIPRLRERRILFQPTINREGYEFIRSRPNVEWLVKQLAGQSTAVIVLGHETLDARYCREEGIPVTVVPNGTRELIPTANFRSQHGIATDEFVILHVANLYRVKNHLGLLDALNPLPPGARLIMVGHRTHETEYVEEVLRKLSARPDVLFVPGLDRQGVASAMQAADLVVLSSDGEVSPLCLLESMSLRRPWLATPECGAAASQAGGLVLPLSEFRTAVQVLMKHQDFRSRLARCGYEHWAACFQWSQVMAGWRSLIETGRLATPFEMPPVVVRQRDALRVEYRRLTSDSPLIQIDRKSQNPVHTVANMRAENMPLVQELASSSHEGPMDQEQFYVNMFVKSPNWSTPEPNSDEAARWSKIASFLEQVLRRVHKERPDARLRILEVGCGRGWLTNLASTYGEAEGVEPVAGVVAHARKMFPHLRFETGTAETVLARPDFRPYDVVLCSEVIEHVPHEQKPAFLNEITRLLTPEGYLILTTPRGEMWEQWQAIAPPCQPVEAWVTEAQLEQYFTGQGFSPLGVERIYVELPMLRYIPAVTPHDVKTRQVLPIYQVWAAQRTVAGGVSARPSMTRPPMVSVIIPTYNRPELLRTAITSVLRQEFQDFQIIVVNDGAESVEAVVSDLNRDGRITLVTHDRNRGLAASRNTGLRHAVGKYVCYLDDDDRFLPDHLGTLVARLEAGDCKVAYTDAWRVHMRVDGGRAVEVDRDRPYSHEFNPHQLLINNYMPVLCVMHERVCLDEVGGFDESLFVHEDWDLWIRLATCYPFAHITKTTAEFTWRTDGTTMSSQSREAFARTAEIIYRKYAPYAAPHPQIVQQQRERLQDLRREAEAHREATVKQYECSIIIPVWNKVDLTKQCLVALAEVTEETSYEVIVVDNGSTDGTAELLNSLSGDVQIIRNRENLGFAKACNQGADAAKGTYLVFLNNDTIPLQGWLTALSDEVKADQGIAVVGSKLLYRDRTVQHAGVAVDRRNLTPYHIYRGFADTHPAVNKRREVNAVTGACLLIRRTLFLELGGFDEGYVNGFEDVDLCYKVREQGHRIVYQPKSVLFHLESQTPGRKQHDADNGRRLMQRWGHAWWHADDDSWYVGDGYKALTREQNGRRENVLCAFESDQDRRAWELVAEAQRAGNRRDNDSVIRLLNRHAEWPAEKEVLTWAASTAEALTQPVLAQAFRRRVTVLDDPTSEQIATIREALAKGQVTAAAARLESLLKHYPAHAEGLLLKAILHMQREQYRDAEIAFTTALNQGADRRKCLMGIGMASMGRSYPQGAWQTFLRVLAEHPDDPESMHWLLRAGTAQNRWEELSLHLQHYLARNPSDLSVRFSYASVLVRADQVEQARQEYNQLAALAPAYDGLAELGRAIAGKEAVLAIGASSA